MKTITIQENSFNDVTNIPYSFSIILIKSATHALLHERNKKILNVYISPLRNIKEVKDISIVNKFVSYIESFSVYSKIDANIAKAVLEVGKESISVLHDLAKKNNEDACYETFEQEEKKINDKVNSIKNIEILKNLKSRDALVLKNAKLSDFSKETDQDDILICPVCLVNTLFPSQELRSVSSILGITVFASHYYIMQYARLVTDNYISSLRAYNTINNTDYVLSPYKTKRVKNGHSYFLCFPKFFLDSVFGKAKFGDWDFIS